MLSFDIGEEEFKKLVSGIEKPGLIQLLAKVDSKCSRSCSPLDLYQILKKSGCSESSGYSYLLESVEKQASKARYSFVGNSPDSLLTINDRKLSLELLNPNASDFFEEIVSKVKKVFSAGTGEEVEEVTKENENKNKNKKREEENTEEEKTEVRKLRQFTAPIPEGKDSFDALRLVFPPVNGIEFLNEKRFERQTFLGGAIGYTAYDAVYDSWLGADKGFESEIPELQYLLVTKSYVFDHLTEEVYIVVTPFINPDSDTGRIYEEALSEAEKLYSTIREVSLYESTGKTAFLHQLAGPQSIELKSTELQPTKLKSAELKSAELKSAELQSTASNSTGLQLEGSGSPLQVCSSDRSEFETSVLRAKEHIFAGDIFQAVLSRKCEFRLEQPPFELYAQLRAINPSPYMYIFEFGDLAIVGASPETLMTVHKRTVMINPIAGTCPRGKSEVEDEILASHMLNDEKERAEHVMLVDLGRNDVRMVCESGSVKVSGFMKVLKYSHVQHIESTVSGTLRPECDQFDAFRAIFPAGTLSGAPKIRAMEIISELETAPRGIYGGGVGYYSWNGDADFAIVIRTLLIQGKKVSLQSGAGIVADSDPAYEFRETERKMAAMLTAIGGETEL
ncbi:anthranilate synthase [Methanosarcina mazei]|uniref:Anthranilate synthase component 1 n=1 Tax=Methanosarcina mazei TaxID=2209 RepID=A0A0F8L8G5_METMZ|nr:anthranilate synthase component I [Methanosarcina mazei]KKG83266.1 anthranilate synthase [Methanosarcina mazei]KKG89345.1 anthranilate synthase [Methanosarcina mazei]KKH05586.1 anthranilate synthase [Methanosarcina mazei]